MDNRQPFGLAISLTSGEKWKVPLDKEITFRITFKDPLTGKWKKGGFSNGEIESILEFQFQFLLKFDQRREREEIPISISAENFGKQVVPKELKNLLFDIMFKAGEPRGESRSRGRKLITQL